jgi:hypothetical protein
MDVSARSEPLDDEGTVRHALGVLGLHGGEAFEIAGDAWKALDRLIAPRGAVDPSAHCPECNGRGSVDYGEADSMGNPIRQRCDLCRGSGKAQPATPRGAVDPEVDRLREALRPFAALADAIDTMGHLTDEEWLRLKATTSVRCAQARRVLNGRALDEDHGDA